MNYREPLVVHRHPGMGTTRRTDTLTASVKYNWQGPWRHRTTPKLAWQGGIRQPVVEARLSLVALIFAEGPGGDAGVLMSAWACGEEETERPKPDLAGSRALIG